ncbi:MAG: ABC transporter ATP-binding protein [Thermoleophilia bacterium]|nr:ABC transporter ATP-binding protein [Thermoleophilia bacterium]
MPAIETTRLSKWYGVHRGIEDISLSVESGEVYGFLGPNGAGKTTLIRTLLDFLHPTAGSATVLGLDSHRDRIEIRRRIGNLAGDFSYDPKRTGRELLSLIARLRGVTDMAYAETLAERFNADLDRPLGQLSRGNRQKIGLLQALFHKPDLLILDEPTGGLDPLMQEEFMVVVSERRERGCTVFISSHELDEVQRMCDRAGIIRDGRLIAVEDIGELMKKSDRRVSFKLADPVIDPGEFRELEGVEDFTADGPEVSFTHRGRIDPVIKRLARHTVLELDLTHPSIEELFLAYYVDDPAGSDGDGEVPR